MQFLDSLKNLLSRAWRWLRFSPNATGWVWLGALTVMILCVLTNYHDPFMPKEASNILELPKNWEPPPQWALVLLYVLAYMRLFVLVGGVVYHVYIVRAFPDAEKMVRPTWIASIFLVVWALTTSLYERWEQTRIGVIGEEVSTTAYVIQLVLMTGLLISPPFVIGYYIRCRIMERYVLRTFLQPLLFCFIAFGTLWIVMDLLNNLQDFRDNKIGGGDILVFYVKMIPFIYVSVAPVTLLLATLYSLGKMSRANELISMLGAGRSLGQVLRPIYIIGLYASFLGMVANYHWAPAAAGNKSKLLDDVKERMRQDILVTGLVYRNSEDRRTWFVGAIPTDLRTEPMRRIIVREEDEHGHLKRGWFAKSAIWWPDDHAWSFFTGVAVTYKDGTLDTMQPFDFDGTGKNRKDEMGWSETPWILMSGSLQPDFLGVPQLISFMQANQAYGFNKLSPYRTHLFYRFAQPWQAFIVVLAAAPLGVVFSRRGMLGGVAGSIFIFFFLLFIDQMFLNLGKGRHLPAWLTVWMPHLILGSFGIYLFRLRAQNRDLPNFSPRALLGSLWKMFRRAPAA